MCDPIVVVKLLSHVWLLCDPTDCSPPGSSVHGDSPDKNAGVGCHFLLQGIFRTQGWSDPHLLHCRQILYCWATREVPCDQTEFEKHFFLHLSLLIFIMRVSIWKVLRSHLKKRKKKICWHCFPRAYISKELPPHLAQEIPLHTLSSLLYREPTG